MLKKASNDFRPFLQPSHVAGEAPLGVSFPSFIGISREVLVTSTATAMCTDDLDVIERHESAVRYYCRGTPVVFAHARGPELFDSKGRRYIDFLCAAGSLNYGHNDPHIKRAVLDYLQEDGILQTLDFATQSKAEFLRKFNEVILSPRGLSYKVQFTAPTGTNAVEAAIKLARKCTGRRSVAAFTNAYHGVSLGALALTGNRGKRAAAGVSLDDVQRLPFDGYYGPDVDTAEMARRLYEDPSSGYEAPAAFIVETLQGEGGLNCASERWLRDIAQLARDLGALLIVDDIQAGCGRTGMFFSFEQFGLSPDIVCLSKSISGLGLPMAISLINPRLDLWQPGEHNGTFRGNNLAFVGATAALDYWTNPHFECELNRLSAIARQVLDDIAQRVFGNEARVVGRGLFLGLRFRDEKMAENLRRNAVQRGLIVETAGAHDEVVKVMPPLNISESVLREGLEILARAGSDSQT